MTKMGRPKLAKGEGKNILIAARFSPDEARLINLAVKRSGESKSEWVRMTLLSKAKTATM